MLRAENIYVNFYKLIEMKYLLFVFICLIAKSSFSQSVPRNLKEIYIDNKKLHFDANSLINLRSTVVSNMPVFNMGNKGTGPVSGGKGLDYNVMDLDKIRSFFPDKNFNSKMPIGLLAPGAIK